MDLNFVRNELEKTKLIIASYQCPICKSTVKHIEPDVHFLNFHTPRSLDDDVINSISDLKQAVQPCAASVCANCGFAMQFVLQLAPIE